MSEVAITMEEISLVKKKMSFEIPWNEVKEELDVVYRDLGKKAKIKGFRPGKVPRKVLESHFKDHAVEPLSFMIWSLVHGMCCLEIRNRIKGVKFSKPETILMDGYNEFLKIIEKL